MTTTTAIMDNETLNKVAFYAIENGDKELLSTIVKKGVPSNLKECLQKAMEKNQMECVKILMDLVIAPISAPAPVPTTPQFRPLKLFDCALRMYITGPVHFGKQSELMMDLVANPVKALQDLEAGVVSKEEINHLNTLGWTALMYLCRNAKKDTILIEKLLDLGADPNIQGTISGFTALMTAFANYEPVAEKVVEILLKRPKIELYLTNHSGENVMTTAIHHCKDMKILKMLMKDPRVDLMKGNILNSILKGSIIKEFGGEVALELFALYFNHPKVINSVTMTADNITKMNREQCVMLFDIIRKGHAQIT